MILGVDVGGTNTDAVLMDGVTLIASRKLPTTPDVSDGIVSAIRSVLNDSDVPTDRIQCVAIGTTHFTNAIVAREGLLQVGLVRIALPATSGVLPTSGWPPDLASVIGNNMVLVGGGYHVDGSVDSELDELAVRDAARRFRGNGLKSVAISALFSPVNDDMEQRAEDIVRNEMPEVSVTRSAEIGSLGLLERENAAIMNASLVELSTRVVKSIRRALQQLRIEAPFFLSQNDGTLMTADAAERYPVLTFASGPTNSMRGAAFLSGCTDALVADIGGTTTDIGMLTNGFPRESSVTVDIGGVRTNFRMPDILALGLGGGSRVSRNGSGLTIGPQSVGFRLLDEALVFGGETLTASDVAVAAGYAQMGDPSRVADLPRQTVVRGVTEIHRMLAEGVDRTKTSAERVPLILVGGGSVLISEDIPGVSEVIVPDSAAVANAVGASIALAGGEVDAVYSYEALGRDAAIEAVRERASQAAVDAGARPGTVEITNVDEIPLNYVPGALVRLRIKAAGELALSSASV
ncbi:MAG: hydantoinase/oxoprolinase family protein [Rhodospirillaceae bacterium]|nr:hydantoinase/oxoprolinase family protein [Rhodospirillaceae bacterium]MDE0362581.1 hydantoinase/oxoprolinase family protein [Rhodospirillaceae bacterium]